MVTETLGSFDAAQLVWIAVSLIGITGMFVFSRAWWRRQPGYREFDPAEKLGLGGYGTYLQLFSVLLCVGGVVGFVLATG